MKNMESKVAIGSKTNTILSAYVERYFGYRTANEYGISAFQFWYYKIVNYMKLVPNSKLQKVGDFYKCSMKYWSVLYIRKIKRLDCVIFSIENIEIDVVNFYNWIYNHQYPTKSNLPKPERWFKKKIEPLFNKIHIIKIYGQEKYNLIDNNGKIILLEWMKKINPVRKNRRANSK